MRLIARRKGRESLCITNVLRNQTWHIEGDFVVVTEDKKRLAVRIPSDATLIEEEYDVDDAVPLLTTEQRV